MNTQQVSKAAGDSQRNRACDACRQHKVRCLPDTSNDSRICQRCARIDRHCTYTAPQKRKQRKRTDTRVAELEKEVQAMRALFEGKKDPRGKADARHGMLDREPQQRNLADGSRLETPFGSEGPPWTSDSEGRSVPWERVAVQALPAPTTETLNSPSLQQDVIGRGIISLELAYELFETYVRDLVPTSPLVIFPPNTKASEVRGKTPTLFLAVISAAAGKSDPSLFSILSSEVLAAYTHRTVMHSEKSLELVQAMIVTSIWYYPPGKFAKLKFYEYIHAAATMAMDIGLGTNPRNPRRRPQSSENNSPQPESSVGSDVEDLAKKRTFLACYLMTTGVAMSTRRPNTMRYNSWIRECTEIISSSPFQSDRVFAHWVRLLAISEDIYTSFSFDDETSIANLSETRVQFMMKSFEKRLNEWKADMNLDITANLLVMAYHYSMIYAHEIAIHDEHPAEDFRPPFRIDKILPIQNDNRLTPAHSDAIATIIFSSHSLLDIMLAMDIDTLRSIPIYNYVRMTYACIILVKLYVSSRSSQSQIGTVVDSQSLRIGFYLENLVTLLTKAVGPMECRSPYTFLGLLMRLRDWYRNQELHEEFPNPVDLFGKIIETPPLEIGPESKNIAPKANLPGLTPACIAAESIYPIDPNSNEMSQLGIKNGFNELSTAYIPQDSAQFGSENLGFSPGMSFMDPFMLFEGLDSMGGDIKYWTSNMDISGELAPGQQ